MATPNMGLTTWPAGSDLFDHTELATNFDDIDEHDHSTGKGLQVPTGGLQDGAVTAIKLAAAVIPVGVIWLTATAAAPTGWLLVNGASYLRAGTYANLFTELGGVASPFGLPDGTHFNVPNLVDKVPVGVSGTIPLGTTGGAKTHTLDTTQIPSHGHQEIFGNNAGALTLAQRVGSLALFGSATLTGLTGGGLSHNNMQPYQGLNYIIKY